MTNAETTAMSNAAAAKAAAQARNSDELRALCAAALKERMETRWHDTGESTKSGRCIAELTGTAGPAELALAAALAAM